MERQDLINKIRQLRQEKNAVILVHYYQVPEIQEIADFVGDSLGLSQKVAKTDADIIVFCGVKFMAETAKIINPNKKVLLPDKNAGCSLADGCTPDAFKAFIDRYPHHTIVSYINCSAEIKAMSDYICTSSNAQKIINSIPKEQPIIFAPDRNLGAYLKKVTHRDLVLWDGSCVVHEAFSIEKIVDLYNSYPNARIAAHPESEEHILRIANYVGSTSGILNYVKTEDAPTFIIATEAGILHEMAKEVPEKLLIPAPSYDENSCNCSECAFMKMNTIEKLYYCLRDETPEILIEDSLRKQALIPIERMLSMA